MLTVLDSVYCPQEEYRSISQQYYRTGKAFIFVFSIESLASFEYLKGKFEDLINQRVCGLVKSQYHKTYNQT